MASARGVTRLIGLALVVVLVARLARRRFDVVEVRGSSMAPTLLPGDRLLVMRLERAPRPGQIVLAPDPREPARELVKRVAAVDGGTVTLRGDNAPASTDARAFGDLPATEVRWHAVGRYWPAARIGPLSPARSRPAAIPRPTR